MQYIYCYSGFRVSVLIVNCTLQSITLLITVLEWWILACYVPSKTWETSHSQYRNHVIGFILQFTIGTRNPQLNICTLIPLGTMCRVWKNKIRSTQKCHQEEWYQMLSILEREEDPEAFDDLHTLFLEYWSQREPEFATYSATYYAKRPGMIFMHTPSMTLHGS